MTVRQVLVTPPAAGVDWSFKVPGQWLPYLFGVTATLITATPLTTIADESGNGNNATINASTDYLIGQQGPFTGGKDNVSILGLIPQQGTNINYCKSPAAATFASASFTLEQWCNIPTGTLPALGGIFGQFNITGNANRFGGSVTNNNHDPWDFLSDWSGASHFSVLGLASRAAWHLIACTYDGVTLLTYRDGTQVGSNAVALPAAGASQRFDMGGNASFGRFEGNAAGAAYYPTNLAAANLANHAAANGSWSAYKTAVLLDSPTGLWRIGQLAAGPNRIVTLKITDGTRTVAQFPASFAAATSDSFIWSWQALGPGAQSSTDGKINSVPIPEIQVDAGYVISVVTLDLAGTDQWGPITLWFDDGTGPTPGGPGSLGEWQYLNALLVPEYQGRIST